MRFIHEEKAAFSRKAGCRTVSPGRNEASSQNKGIAERPLTRGIELPYTSDLADEAWFA